MEIIEDNIKEYTIRPQQLAPHFYNLMVELSSRKSFGDPQEVHSRHITKLKYIFKKHEKKSFIEVINHSYQKKKKIQNLYPRLETSKVI